MGTINYIVNPANKTMFELGKWLSASDFEQFKVSDEFLFDRDCLEQGENPQVYKDGTIHTYIFNSLVDLNDMLDEHFREMGDNPEKAYLLTLKILSFCKGFKVSFITDDTDMDLHCAIIRNGYRVTDSIFAIDNPNYMEQNSL